MTIQQTIGLEVGSYRRGIVLGLTMAETMLLLVFCLLLAAAVVFERELQKRNEKEAQLQSALAELTAARVYLKDKIGDNWQHVVEGVDASEQLKKVGLSLKEVTAAAPFIGAVMELHEQGSSAGDIKESVKIVAAVNEALRDSGITTTDPAQIAQLVRTGAQAQTTASMNNNRGKHNWPPIITLSEAQGHFFESGSARLSPQFKLDLSGPVSERLLQIIKEYDVNTIEVIGHTDEQPIVERPSNLDKELLPVLEGRAAVDGLVPADNAGLGLARAVSVVGVLSQDKRLSGYRILPYSGAQIIDLGDKLSNGSSTGDVRQRRRIEIRLRRGEEQQASIAPVPTVAPPPKALVPPVPAVTLPPKEADITISGRASVIDGDTIDIHGQRIRLWGIDAIESKQTCELDGRPWRCGQDIAFGLSAHLEGQNVASRDTWFTVASPRK
jgi:flagellar motor protein MotB